MAFPQQGDRLPITNMNGQSDAAVVIGLQYDRDTGMMTGVVLQATDGQVYQVPMSPERLANFPKYTLH